MLGVAAATALPSEVFPFRKIFLPENPKPIDPYTWAGLARSPYPGRLATPLTEADITAVELEMFAKQIPDLFNSGIALYSVFRRRAAEAVLCNGIAFIDRNGVYTYDENEKMVKISETPMRIPLRNRPAQMVVTEVNDAEKTVTFAPKRRSLRELLHGPAMPENVMEFIDGLESDLSKS